MNNALRQTVEQCRRLPITGNRILANSQPQRCSSTKNPSLLRRRGTELTVPSLKAPDYLVPPAYRTQDGGGGHRRKDRNNRRGGQTSHHHNHRRNGPHPKGRSNNYNNASQQHGHHRSRRKASLGQRSGPNARRLLSHPPSSAARGKKVPDIETMRTMETDLSNKMADYIRRLSGVSLDELDMLDSHLQTHLPNAKDVAATEGAYEDIVSDYKELIGGWADIAESYCAAKWMEHTFGNDGEDDDNEEEGAGSNSAVTVAEYEDAVARAERHLESFEALARNRANVLAEERSSGGDNDAEGAGTKGRSGLLSFFENFFDDGRAREESSAPEEAVPPSSSDEGTPQKGSGGVPKIDASLYEHVLLANHSAYCFGREAKEDATRRSNRLLNRWVSLYCMSTDLDRGADAANDNDHGDHDKPNTKGEPLERKMFHIVLRQNVDMWTKEGVERAEDWLSRMRYLEQTLGKIDCAPNVDTYNLVLLGYCHLCKLFHRNKAGFADEQVLGSKKEEVALKSFIVEGAARVLSELADDGEEGKVARPNIMSLNLALNAMAKAGRHMDKKAFQKTNNLVYGIVGEEQFRAVMGVDNPEKAEDANDKVKERTPKTQIEPTLDTFHWLVDIYAASGNIVYVKQGVALLRKMIQIRRDEEEKASNGSRNASASFAPSTGTHNNVLRALLGIIDDLPEAERLETAQAATELLDSMVQHGSSFPSPVTFVFLLQMWQKSNLPEAGEYAEEILSRMEVAAVHHEELKSFSNAYVLALECWLTAAKAGKSGAAERAFRLLELMEAQAGRGRIVSDSLADALGKEYEPVFDALMHPHVRTYPLVMKICAATNEKDGMSAAVNTVFKVYDKMIQDEIKPGARIFEHMYTSVRNFLDHHPEEERQGLLQRVFEPASKNGITRGELMGRHKQSIRKGYLVA